MKDQQNQNYPFLLGGGELGEMTRNFDWSKTSVGAVETWPQSLRTTVGIILHTDFPMFLWWGEEMLQFYNDAYRPSMGQSGKHPKALGQNGRECWPEIWEVIYPLIQQVRTTGKSFFLEDQLIPIFRNGRMEDVYWTFSYSAVIGETGSIDGVLVVCTETTKRVEVERTQSLLKQSESNLRNIILQAPVPICIFRGPHHLVEIANEKMFELWGRSGELIIGKPIFEALPEAGDQGFEKLLNDVYVTGNTFSANGLPINLPRGENTETIYVNFVYQAFREGDGNIAGVLAVATDVTAQLLAAKKIEEQVEIRTRELAESNYNLNRSNHELGEFAYIVSHDLQEPARKIGTFITMLNRNLGQMDDRSKDLLHKIETSSARMMTLIQDVLSLSQLVRKKEVFQTVDLNEVLQAVKADFELVIEKKRAAIRSNELPVIEGVPVQINQLFSNLISNALKFSEADKSPEITISFRPLTLKEVNLYPSLNSSLDYFQISFVDNGIGFEQENAQQIFNIFHRLHGRSEFEGTGIGLALCRKIAENHNGYIFATSSLGAGAIFTIILPLKQTVGK